MNSIEKLKFVLSSNFYTDSVAGPPEVQDKCKIIKDAWGGKGGFVSKVADCIKKIKPIIDDAVRSGTIQENSTTVTHTFRLTDYLKPGSDFASCSDVAKGDPNAGLSPPGNEAGGASSGSVSEKIIAIVENENHPSTIRKREINKLKCELLLAALEKEKAQAMKVLDALFANNCPNKKTAGFQFKNINSNDTKTTAQSKLEAYYLSLKQSISGNGRQGGGPDSAHYNGSFCKDSKPRNAPNAPGGGDRRPEHGGFR